MRQLIIAVIILLSGNILAQDYKITLEPTIGKFLEVEYYMWIPENIKKVKGIILHQHGCGEDAYKSGRNAFYDTQWRALAKKHDFALMGSSYLSTNACFDWIEPEEGSYETFIHGISELAKKSDHKELEDVPWAIWGHSGGGHWAYEMALQHPDKILCSVLKSPAWTDTSSLGIQVPMLCLLGVREGYDAYSKFVWSTSVEAMKYRIRENAPICIAADPTSGHESAQSRLLAIPFIDEILKLRLNDGTTNFNRSNQCYIDLGGDKFKDEISDIEEIDNANWYPNKLFAKKWLEFIKTGYVTDSTPPLNSPYNIEVKNQDYDVVISWQADADIESGIKGFKIYRNNEVINTDSVQSKWNFQFDYHDNPKEIHDKFEFTDRNINKNEEYSYQISLVNQAGLESTKSKSLIKSSCSNNSSNKKSIQDGTETQSKNHKSGFKNVKDAKQIIVYHEKGRFGAWPANNGAWIFSGDEMLVSFTEAPYELKKHSHNIGSPELQTSWLARSTEGGETWSAYNPDNFVGDYGNQPELKRIDEPIDFESSRFVMRIVGTAYHVAHDPRGHFFYSYDAGQSWKGPYSFGDLINYPELKKYGLDEITSRTDYIVTGTNECIMMMSAREKGKFGTDRLFSIKTEDGGKTFQFLGWVIKPFREDEIDETNKVALNDDPDKNPYTTQCRAVMSQTQLLPNGKLITVIRRKYTAADGDAINSENWVDAYASEDGGKTWAFQSTAGNGGKGNGNPPALAITSDGRLCTVFGEREFGTIQVAYSSNEGKSWSEPQILFDEFWSEDMEYADMGYPRVLARSDGKMVAIFYYSTKEHLHHIHATIWDPNL